ncbi:Gfo/Idh/MocA family protein [Sessilibacter corallicola]|uniref:Gfo/Idh/MocA family protein n=1 Tax=Sessilibacter corallicola TaxID=2904075 RepID=UPI001E3D90C6|nr:Gfo/Idh/MocA family oxidoreductase [Sessilibacter corallicola]
MDGNLSIGIVGCGSITEIGILPHLALHGVAVEALCDIALPRVELLADQYHVPKRYTDYQKLLDDSNINALIIASPITLHYQQAHAALTAGKHVYVQKTFTETSQQAYELIDIAQNKNLTLAASPGQILLPVMKKAAELICNDYLGTIYSAISVNWAPGHEYEPSRQDTSNSALNPNWYYQPGGGPLRDMGIYALHTLISLLGDVEEVFAYANTPVAEKTWGESKIPVNTPDNYGINLKFNNGTLAQVVTGFCSMPALVEWGHISIVGSMGAMDIRRVPGFGSRYELVINHNHSSEVERFSFGSGLGDVSDAIDEAHVALDILDFLTAVKNKKKPGASPNTAVKAIALVEAIEYSIDTRQPVSVSYKK